MPIYLIFIIVMVAISVVAVALWKGQIIAKRTALLLGSACGLAVLIVSFVLFWGMYFVSEMGGTSQSLSFPDDKVAISVDVTANGKTIKYTEEDWIADFMYLVQTAEPTNKLSVQDFPVVDNYVKMNIHFQDKTVTLFLYKDKGEYYIEQPYQGIYRIEQSIEAVEDSILHSFVV